MNHTPVIVDKLEIKEKSLDFYEALRLCETKQEKIRRKEWPDYVYGQMVENILMIFMDGRDGKTFYQWIVQEGDLSATDWEVTK